MGRVHNLVAQDRGNASVELAVVAPALMLLILGVLHFGLWYHAKHVVGTVAFEAARRAAAEDASASEGEDYGRRLLRVGLGNAAERTSVRVEEGRSSMSATATARVRGVVPVPGLTVVELESSSTVYKERFRARGEEE